MLGPQSFEQSAYNNELEFESPRKIVSYLPSFFNSKELRLHALDRIIEFINRNGIFA